MLASVFIMRQQIDNHIEIPLLSFRDARILIVLQIVGTKQDQDFGIKQMEKDIKNENMIIENNLKINKI